MSDCYYELVDDADPQGERFVATDMVRSTWSAAIQHGAPVSALLVRALERFESREDTRLSRVLIDLLGPVPAEGDLWVRAKRERAGKQIELISAEMLALGPDGAPRPVAKASGWRLQTINTEAVVHARGKKPPFSRARPTSTTNTTTLGSASRRSSALRTISRPRTRLLADDVIDERTRRSREEG